MKYLKSEKDGQSGPVRTLAAVTGCLLACVTAHANSTTAIPNPISIANISELNTGQSQDGGNFGDQDVNWQVALISVGNDGGSGNPPPGPIPGGSIGTFGSTYLVPSNSPGEMFGPGGTTGAWAANTATSTWLTYADPNSFATGDQNGDVSGSIFEYQAKFTPSNTGQISISYVTDNGSYLYVNNTSAASTDTTSGAVSNNTGLTGPDEESQVFTTYDLSVTAGTAYTIDLDVLNTPLPGPNPTGARLQFAPLTSVPDGGRTAMLLGAAMLGLVGLNWLRGKATSC